MRFLRLFEGPPGVIERLPRKLVRGEVVFLAVMRGGNPVGMRRHLVHLRGDSMCVPWHGFSLDQLTLCFVMRHAGAIAPCLRPCGPAAGQHRAYRGQASAAL